MKDAIAFKLGDRVYCPFHGYGVVSAIYDDNRTYPVQVTWDGSEYKKEGEIDSFTANGFTIIGLESDTGKLIVVQSAPLKEDEKEGKFKVGDMVWSREFGVGVVDEILAPEYPYPITVNWIEGSLGYGTYSSFTLEGHYYPQRSDAEKDITLLEVRGAVKEGETDKDIRDKRLDDDGINDGRRKNMDYQKIARGIVLNYVREHLDKTDNVQIALDDVYLVWFCKTLQNWKALVSTVLPDDMYYEVTYNGDKKEVYLDAYKKFDSREIDES